MPSTQADAKGIMMIVTSLTPEPEHVDVLIIGAGLSGIGAAWHLQDKQPGRSYAILEARDASGGTWDLFRYPGIRSDSDLSTFAFAFKPWTGAKAIADGPDILRYLRDTATEAGIDEHIRYRHKVTDVAWSTEDARWTITAEHDGEPVTLTAGWLFAASGYYRYDQGFAPTFAGTDDFEGRIVHPQHWPDDLDVTGKRIAVIGSGATAVTLVPALVSDGAAEVTMVQRSPSYIMSLPARDVIADKLRAWFGDERGHELTRRKNIWRQRMLYKFCQARPQLARKLIRKLTEKQVPEGVDVDTHFNPKYDPWDQRLCAVPDGDLFKTMRRGQAKIVTGAIETFDATGLQMVDGSHVDADVIVTATGLNLLIFGGVEMTVDGEVVRPADTVAYKAMMLGGVPNFAFAIGYTNSSWTLKVDLVCEHLCRLLAHMDQRGYDVVVPDASAAGEERRPLLDFSAGYVQRSIDDIPKQGTAAPWRVVMDYNEDVEQLRKAPVGDPALRFSMKASKPELVAA